jgi:hypothetical protein
VAINSETWETLNPDGRKTHFEFELTRKVRSKNGANGMSDIEGKAARVAASECGQRVSFNVEEIRPTSNVQHTTPNETAPRSTTGGYSFPFSYINILYGSTEESVEREVSCCSQGEHGGQCYEAGSATSAEP